MDKATAQRIQLAHPSVREELILIVEECDLILTGKYKVRITWTLRTFQQQEDIYQQGRTRPGDIVTFARPGQSWHNYGLAVDICLYNAEGKMAVWDTKSDFDGDMISDWMEVVNVFKKYGWFWGGDWPKPKTDSPHFEKPFGMKISEAKAKYAAKNTVLKNTSYIFIA